MIKPSLKIGKWFQRGMGGFHVGFFVDWEPWQFNFGVDLGIWSISLEFEIPYSEERRERLLAEFSK